MTHIHDFEMEELVGIAAEMTERRLIRLNPQVFLFHDAVNCYVQLCPKSYMELIKLLI